MGYYGYGMPSAAGMLGVPLLAFVLLLAGFVASIFVYRKFVGKNAAGITRETWSWKRFFAFDTLIISGVLKYLYILSAIETAVMAIVALVGSCVALGVMGFVVGLFSSVFLLVFGEFLCRILFEYAMLMISLTQNSSDIKSLLMNGRGVAGGPARGAAVGQGAGPIASPQPFAGNAVPAPTVQSAAPQSPQGESWVCPTCGKTNARGVFCSGCGTPKA